MNDREKAFHALADRYAGQAEELEKRLPEKRQADEAARRAKIATWREAERMARFWADPNKV